MVKYLDLLDKKYKLGGRGPDFYDCYGLVKEMFSRCGKELPNYIETVQDFDKISKRIITEKEKPNSGWIKITKKEATRTIQNCFGEIYIRPNSLILMRIGRFGCHIGFILDNLHFIHCWDRADSVIIERIDYWKNNILGAYDYDLCIRS